ncbi:MAG: Cell shape-determining protein MreC [Chloroflexi bacterium]|jgi:rod shape-determining protein MreC|nr:Cell shape-determining protein MreC [Chloroflexota bacterium]
MFKRNTSEVTQRLTFAAMMLVLSLVIMIADSTGILRPVEQVTSTFLIPLENASNQLGSNMSRFSDFLSDNEKLRNENASLRQELQTALAEQGKVAELANRVDQLEKQLEFRANPENRKYTVVNAQVVNQDASGINQAITINKGTNDGLNRGMPVVNTAGYLVGRVVSVETKKSNVFLISDNNVGVNVYTQRYDADNKRVPIQAVDGTALGQFQLGNRDKIKIGLIQPDADIKVDDWVFTNGKGGNYPANLLIGRVTKVSSQDGQPEKEAVVRPIADLDHLQEVLVITSWGTT